MADSVPSDHSSVTTVRASIARSGGTRRPCLRLPDGLDVDGGDVVRLVLAGRERHARVVTDDRGPLLRGAFDNRRLARNPGEGDNRLVEWCGDVDRAPGDAVELDEVVPGDLYGLRVPGERVVYDVSEGPSDSLAAIAEQIDGDGG